MEFNNILVHLRRNLIAIPLVLGGMVVSSYLTGISKQDEIDAYIEEYEEFREEAVQANNFADSLKVEIAEADSIAEEAIELAEEYAEDIQELEEETETLKEEVALKVEELNEESTIEEALEVVEDQRVIIEQQDSTLRMKDQQIAQLWVSIEQKDYQINLLTASTDSLQIIIANIPPPPPNPNKFLGFIPKPTRTQTFIIGAIVGGVAAYKLTG